MWGQFSWKKSLLVPWKILGVFVDTLTADENYSLLNRDNLKHHIQMQLSQKQNTFSNFFFHFQNLNGILNISKKEITLLADVFLNLRTPKTWLDKCLKTPVSDDPLTNNVVNAPKHC